MPANLLSIRNGRGAGDRFVVNPRWANRLEALGLRRFADFFDLPGEILSGHADRHVLCAEWPGLDAILKREHRTGWRTRIRHRICGSLSYREATILTELHRAGVSVPEWIAWGEAADGRAFLLLRRLRGYVDLRKALAHPSVDRSQVIAHLGEALGRLHGAGYVAPDLSAKHVLVKPSTGRVVLIDWPRARRSTNQRERQQDLARIQATAPAVLPSVLSVTPPAADAGRLANSMDSPRPAQRLRWLDGERLCVARPLWRAYAGEMPAWLFAASCQTSLKPKLASAPLCRLGTGWLTQLPPATTWTRWSARLAGRPIPATAVKQAALAFTLQRRGVPITPVLAFGGRDDGSGFLLVQAPPEHRDLGEYLALPRPRRSALLHRLGALARTCHESGVATIPADRLVVDCATRPRLRLVIDGSLHRERRLGRKRITDSLQALARDLDLARRGDLVRLLRGYVGRRELRHDDLRLASALLQREAA